MPGLLANGGEMVIELPLPETFAHLLRFHENKSEQSTKITLPAEYNN
jgi:hypothetical protein